MKKVFEIFLYFNVGLGALFFVVWFVTALPLFQASALASTAESGSAQPEGSSASAKPPAGSGAEASSSPAPASASANNASQQSVKGSSDTSSALHKKKAPAKKPTSPASSANSASATNSAEKPASPANSASATSSASSAKKPTSPDSPASPPTKKKQSPSAGSASTAPSAPPSAGSANKKPDSPAPSAQRDLAEDNSVPRPPDLPSDSAELKNESDDISLQETEDESEVDTEKSKMLESGISSFDNLTQKMQNKKISSKTSKELQLQDINQKVVNIYKMLSNYQYDNTGRRDPFADQTKKEPEAVVKGVVEEMAPTNYPTGEFSLDEIDLVGIKWNSKVSPSKAIFKAPDGLHWLQKNDRIGNKRAVIYQLREDEVVILEPRTLGTLDLENQGKSYIPIIVRLDRGKSLSNKRKNIPLSSPSSFTPESKSKPKQEKPAGDGSSADGSVEGV